ncbi:MAG TPA: methyltransferase domain-containing protein [Candidatus Saccharimonadales bacterium]|nr:methyltransferase domain-containing protein [Candidatus Saccharimonadales bacterium]
MLHRSLFILGRQSGIARAELESLYDPRHLQPFGDICVTSDLETSNIDFRRLGGTIKLGSILGVVDTIDRQTIQAALPGFIHNHIDPAVSGKLSIGLSTYGVRVTSKQVTAMAFELKKTLRTVGYSIRLIPNQEPALNTAQVIHNRLTGHRGIELLLVQSGGKIIVARTEEVQDIVAYTKRDQARPKRDAFVGMLPPKLAQIIINLAAGPSKPSPNSIVLDPFCGSGVILQEALLMGFGAYGSDIEPRMIEYSRENLEWLAQRKKLDNSMFDVGDATTFQWHHPFATVASETYLGSALNTWPSSERLSTIIRTCNTILGNFLQNIAPQIPRSRRLCLAVPTWINPSNGIIKHLPILDQIEDLGYNQVSFQYTKSREMVYYRPGQLVGRELLVLTRR